MTTKQLDDRLEAILQNHAEYLPGDSEDWHKHHKVSIGAIKKVFRSYIKQFGLEDDTIMALIYELADQQPSWLES